jgi:CarD family transcriptional regulator
VLNDKLIVERKSLGVPGEDARDFVDEKSTCRSEEQYSCTDLEQCSCADLERVRESLRVERLTMAPRSKSKKTTSSKTKKTGARTSAKPRSKRAAKAAPSSSVRNRVSKSKPASNTRVARKTSKTSRAKLKNAATKLSKRKRTNSNVRTMTHQSGAAKRPASVAKRKVAASKSLSKTTRAGVAAKRASAVRAHLKEQEAKLSTASRSAQEARAAAEKGSAPLAGSKPSSEHGVHVPHSTELASPAKPAAAVVKVQKAGAPEEASSAAKTLKSAGQRQGFKLSEFVVYPAHGVGQIIAIEEQEVAGFKLELFVINFSKDKLTLRVPTSKVTGVGMRKISDPDTARRSLEILTGRARVKRTMWSRRAQEYETKINSGDINAIAEVVRDLYRSEAQPEQSYSERQLYEAALDRMVREIAVVQKSNEIDALKTVEAQLQKGQSRTSKSIGPASAASEIEQAA